MGKFSHYAVRGGRQCGVYTSWAECEAQVKGFAGAIFKGFSSLKEAESFLLPGQRQQQLARQEQQQQQQQVQPAAVSPAVADRPASRFSAAAAPSDPVPPLPLPPQPQPQQQQQHQREQQQQQQQEQQKQQEQEQQQQRQDLPAEQLGAAAALDTTLTGKPGNYMRKVRSILIAQLAAVNVGMAGNDLEAVAEAAKTTVELLRIAHGALHSRETKSFVRAVVKSHAAVRKQDRHVAINHGAAGGRGGGMARARERGGHGAHRPPGQHGHYGSGQHALRVRR